jgi:nucleotide-binding universal stress UspA family protein
MHIAIAFDGSSGAHGAVTAVAKLFPDARATVVIVPEPTPLRAASGPMAAATLSPSEVGDVREALRTQLRADAEATALAGVERARTLGLEAELLVTPADTPLWVPLLHAVRELDADVLVCGTRGNGGFARAVLGSTSSALLHHTHVPLLVVPEGAGALDGDLLIAYDRSEQSDRAIAAAAKLFPGRSALVTHVWRSPHTRATLPQSDERTVFDELHDHDAGIADEATAAGVAAAREAGLDPIGLTLSSGGGWRAAAAAARQHDAAVIVAGSHGHGVARSVLLGSFSSGLVHNAELPTLIVPPSS